MITLIALALSSASFGAPYPAGKLDGEIDRQRCVTRYRLSTADPIDRLAAFYINEAASARVHLLDDSGRKFADYRTLTFATQPRFLFVLMSRKTGRTTVRVAYHLTIPSGCK